MSIDGMVGKCTECKTVQKDNYIIRKGFGFDAPCQYCGGVIAEVPAEYQNDENLEDQMDLQRGIGTTIHPE